METFVLILNATNFTHIDNELLNFVSYERQSTIEKYLFDKDKRLSLYSSLLTKMQLSKLLNCAPNKLNFGFTALNKPCLLNKPEIFSTILIQITVFFLVFPKKMKLVLTCNFAITLFFL